MYTLTLARLFELPKRYKIRSILSTLGFLDANRAVIPFDARTMLIKELAMSGSDALSDAELTHSAVEIMRNRLPIVEGTQLFDALDAILFRRDKKIAHNEITDPDEMPAVTWGRTLELLELAKTIVSAIGGGYFGISFKLYSTDGSAEYSLSKDAHRSAVALNRLLESAAVIKKRDEPKPN